MPPILIAMGIITNIYRIFIYILAGIGIIALLGEIITPSFTSQPMKSQQAEAKSHLARIFAAQKAMHAEFNMYGHNFDQLAVQFENEINYQFYIGINKNFPPKNYPLNNVTTTCLSSTDKCDATKNASGIGAELPRVLTRFPVKAFTSDNIFLAVAVYADEKGCIDLWTIDQDKNLENPYRNYEDGKCEESFTSLTYIKELKKHNSKKRNEKIFTALLFVFFSGLILYILSKVFMRLQPEAKINVFVYTPAIILIIIILKRFSLTL